MRGVARQPARQRTRISESLRGLLSSIRTHASLASSLLPEPSLADGRPARFFWLQVGLAGNLPANAIDEIVDSLYSGSS